MNSVQDEAQSNTETPPAPSMAVGAMPDTRDIHFIGSHHHLRFLSRPRLSASERALAEPPLIKLGGPIGGEIEDLAAEADKHTQTPVTRDKRGERADEIVTSR